MSKPSRKAIKLFRDFRGHDPEHVDNVEIPDYDEAIVIGYLDFVGYNTERDGEDECYVHHFNKRSRPLLCSSPDGKQLFILGGGYKFGERGIIG